MAIAFRASTNNGAGAFGADVTLNKPTGTVSGDLLVAIITLTATTTNPLTAPTGWTLLDSVSISSTHQQIGLFYYLVAGASEGASYKWTGGTASNFIDATMNAYSGVDNTTPFDVTGSHASGTSSLSVPSITTVTANTMLLLAGGSWAGSAATLQTGFTNRSGQTDGSTLADKAQAAAGATGACTFNAGATEQVAFLEALRPAGGGGTVSGSATIVANAVLSETAAQVVDPTTPEVANAVLSESSALIIASGAVVANAALAESAQIVTSGAEVANAAISAPTEQVVNPGAPVVANALLNVTGGVIGLNLLVANAALVETAAQIRASAPVAANAAMTQTAQIIARGLAVVTVSALVVSGHVLGQTIAGDVTLADTRLQVAMISDTALQTVALADVALSGDVVSAVTLGVVTVADSALMTVALADSAP